MGICYCVLVIYNKNIKDSISYKMLQKQQIPVIVCDNSTTFEKNEQIVKDNQNVYISMNGNQGLSKAYNRALDWMFHQEISTDDYLVLFDDDTEIPDELNTKMENVISQNHPDILLPVVKDDAGILSPCRIQNGKVSRLSDIDDCSYEEITAINTGMTIRLSLFKDYRYDEHFFLDYIDHHFEFSISVDQLCKIAYMGNTKLKTKFKEYFGCNITDYIIRKRIDQAQHLLIVTELSIAEIAQAIGYERPESFAKQFHRITGLLPREYRKLVK